MVFQGLNEAKSEMMMKCPVKKGILHLDPAWASFALSSCNIFIEILFKGVVFKLFFTSLVLSSVLQECSFDLRPFDLRSFRLARFGNSVLLSCALMTARLRRRAFVLRACVASPINYSMQEFNHRFKHSHTESILLLFPHVNDPTPSNTHQV